MSERGVANSRLIDDPRIAKLLSEVSDFAVYALDADGVCVAWEPISRHYQYLPVEAVIGRSLSDFYPDDQKPNYLRGLRNAAETGRNEGEGWRVRADGARCWMRTITLPLCDEDGALTGYMGIVYDATRQHESASALRKNEEVYDALIQGLKDHVICVLDRGGHIRKWNSDAPAILGREPTSLEGSHFSEFFTAEDRKSGEPAKILALARKRGRYQAESWRLRGDDSRFRVDSTVFALPDADGNLFGYGIVVRDITDRYEAATQLLESQAALEQSEKLRSLGELTGGIAHDFNNLLTVVRGSAELLQTANLSEDKKARHIAAIIETADRAAELTAQLLSFARRQPLQPKRVSLNALLADMTDMLRRTLGGGINILHVPAPDLGDVCVDPTQLRNLILNAAINARDAMKSSGTLTLATRNVPDGTGNPLVSLAISDTGEGMVSKVAARVFEPFFTTKGLEGTGLGLSQAYGFAAQSGGDLRICSEAGRGSTLTLLLPRHTAGLECAAAPGKPENEIEQVPNGTRILLVEDSRTVALFAQTLLEDMGCEIVHARNAQEAMRILEREADRFDIVFSDIVMPGLSGLELAAKVREQKPTLPILLATGYSEAAARGEGSEFPILPKPYKREKLSEMLGQTISSFREAA